MAFELKYFKNILSAISTTQKGLRLSLKYFFSARKGRGKEYLSDDSYFEKSNGTFTVQFPKEEIPVPDHGRYQLHNEIDDCIVCDKCAKICPVDCIEIEPIRAKETFGQTSDGTPLRIHAAKFNIDMAKCCFCGLCTVVCPTECLTMTKNYDYSTSDILDHNFSFGKMNEKEIAEKKKEFEDFQNEKAQKAIDKADADSSKPVVKPGAKPMVKPSIKPKAESGDDSSKDSTPPKKPVFKPRPIPKRK